MKTTPGLGTMLLAIWLIAFGLLNMPLLHLNFAYSGDFLAIFAVVVGILLLLKR